MGFFSAGESNSESSQRTVNNQQTVSDQAIAVRVQGSGGFDNEDNDIKLGKNASLTIHQGLSADDFQSGLAAFANSLRPNVEINPSAPDHDASFSEALKLSLAERVNANTARAVDEVQAGSPGKVNQFVWWAVGIVVLFAAVVLMKKKRA